MSEPKPVWNFDFEPISEPPGAIPIGEWRELRNKAILTAFAVPPELLRPHIGAIERVEREAAMAQVRQTQGLIADAFRPFIRAMDDYTDTMARLALELEELRMKMIGRRYQAIFAVLVVLVYLIVEWVTR